MSWSCYLYVTWCRTNKNKSNTYTRNKVKHDFLLLLINRMLIYVFKGFKIEFHTELKNELFVQGHHI